MKPITGFCNGPMTATNDEWRLDRSSFMDDDRYCMGVFSVVSSGNSWDAYRGIEWIGRFPSRDAAMAYCEAQS